jgi:hypothetical protein
MRAGLIATLDADDHDINVDRRSGAVRQPQQIAGSGGYRPAGRIDATKDQ